jgi:hypothetical protein
MMNEAVKMVRTSPLAIWSLILGILTFLCFGFFAGIPAVICGHVARSRIRQSQGNLTGGGLALAGLILGYVGTVITTLMILLALIAVPRYIELEKNAKSRKIEAAIADLNNRESLAWAEQKISSSGWQGDAGVLNAVDYNLGEYYTWPNGNPSAGGRDLSYRNTTFTLSRTPSTAKNAAIWRLE